MSRHFTTANGEDQTREEATVFVQELDLFVMVMFLEKTLAQFFQEALRGWENQSLDQRSKTASHQKLQEHQL